MKKFHLKNFDVGHLRVLHEAALKHEAAVRQWSESAHWSTAAEYAAKLEAVVELMESITVFHHGDGLAGFGAGIQGANHTVAQRLHSFDVLFEPARERVRVRAR